MDEEVQVVGAEVVAIASMLLGLVLEFAPFLLTSIAPPLASQAPITIGTFSVPANMAYGILFIFGGAFLLFYYLYWRGD